MEMKINFNKLFDFGQSSSHTPSTTSLQNSYHIDEPSIISTPSDNINLHYKFNEALFFDSSLIQQNDSNINILEDLSSIGRSFDDSFEKQARQKPDITPKTKYSNNNQRHTQFKSQQTFYPNDKDIKSPGQRLYYESQIKKQRKIRQLEKIKQEIQQKNSKEITFKPAINQKSKKILQMAESPLRRINNLKKSNKKIQTFKEIKSSTQRKEQEDLKNCTFKPTIIKGPKQNYLSNTVSEKDLSKVFDSLYNQHRAKQKRRKTALQQLEKKEKKMTQEQLEQFFKRNQDYIQERKHREELLKAVSLQYDLTSGRKLFEPKLNGSLSAMLSSMSVEKLIHSPSSPKAKNSPYSQNQELSSSASLRNMHRQNSLRGNSSKSRSNQKNHNHQISKKTSQFIREEKEDIKQKRSQKHELTNNVKEKQLILKNNNTKYKPLPYQVTKLNLSYQDKDPTSNNYQFCGDKNVERSEIKLYSQPKSSIFNKIKAAESVFEQDEESSDAEQLNIERESSQNGSIENEKNEQKIEEILNIIPNQQNLQKDQDYLHITQSLNVDQNSQRSYKNGDIQDLTNQRLDQEVEAYQEDQSSMSRVQDSSLKEIEFHQDQINDKQSSIHLDLTNHLDSIDNPLIIPNDEYLQQNQSLQTRDYIHDEKSLQKQAQKDQQKNQQKLSEQELEQKNSENEESIRNSANSENTEGRSNFLESIVQNPIYSHKYNNLFALENPDAHLQKEDQSVNKQEKMSQIQLHMKAQQQASPSTINNHSISAISTHSIQQAQAQNKLKRTQTLNTNKGLFNKPLFLSKDSEQEKKQESITAKSWHEIFSNSLKFEKDQKEVPSQSEISELSIVSQRKVKQPDQSAEKPSKKTINIASLLKAKKKVSLKPNQN